MGSMGGERERKEGTNEVGRLVVRVLYNTGVYLVPGAVSYSSTGTGARTRAAELKSRHRN